MSMQTQRAELERLGFRIVEEQPDSLVALARRFHWDCVLTSVTYVLFVRRVAELSAADVERDREELQERASRLNPSLLPRGLQKGIAVITAYLADRVQPDARVLCEAPPKMRFAFFYLPAAFDRSTGVAHSLRGTPVWGAIYFSKFRFLVDRMFNQSTGSTAWPLSIAGAVLTAFCLLTFAVSFSRLFLR